MCVVVLAAKPSAENRLNYQPLSDRAVRSNKGRRWMKGWWWRGRRNRANCQTLVTRRYENGVRAPRTGKKIALLGHDDADDDWRQTSFRALKFLVHTKPGRRRAKFAVKPVKIETRGSLV